MLPEEIENYFAQIARVLRPQGRCFVTAFLFDDDAEAAVAQGSTIFNFRYRLGPCLTFDRGCPQEGIACEKEWLLGLLAQNGFRVDLLQLGNWQRVRSYEISQDTVVATKQVLASS
jgi:ubiquinone/menaquinone biosynthesis C-methylase UbiE